MGQERAMKKKALITISLAIVAAATIAFAQQEDRFAAVKKAEGKPLPKFSMKMLNDKVITNKDIQGKVVVFDFWATWCGPCKAAAPKLDAMYKEFGKQGFEIIGANLAEKDSKGQPTQAKDNAVAYVNEHKYVYAFTYGNDQIGKDWGVPGYPTFFIVGRDGVVKEVMVGFNEKRMRELVTELLKQK
jgi:thiol-disulfide isomerase/thioredoxin